MTRKDFVRLCGSSCLAVMGMALFAGQVNAIAYPVRQKKEDDNEDVLTIEKSRFIKEAEGETITYRSYITVTPENSDYPILVCRFAENDYAAVLLRCTHRGAELNINGDMLTCPAHDSEFSVKGEVLKGPAEEPLQTFTITTDEQNIYISLV